MAIATARRSGSLTFAVDDRIHSGIRSVESAGSKPGTRSGLRSLSW
jgi:hypothetical protein